MEGNHGRGSARFSGDKRDVSHGGSDGISRGQRLRNSCVLDVELGCGTNGPGLETFGSHFGSLTLSFFIYKISIISPPGNIIMHLKYPICKTASMLQASWGRYSTSAIPSAMG